MNKTLYRVVRFKPVLGLLAVLCCLVLAHSLARAASVVVYVNEQGSLAGFPRADVTDEVSALAALATPPPGFYSAVPAGTTIDDFWRSETNATVEFSSEIASLGMDDLRLQMIFDQVRATLMPFGIEGAVRLQSGGLALSDYLPATPSVAPRPALQAESVPNLADGSALAGRSISLSPGHGKVWTGSSYVFERPVYCAPLNREDDHNLEIMTYLDQYLRQDGATWVPAS